MRTPDRHQPARPLPLALALVVVSGSVAPLAPAKSLGDAQDTIAQRRPAFSGQAFEGVNLPVRPRDGGGFAKGDRVWSWGVGATQRLLLDRDCTVELGPFAFRADRAALWLEPIELLGGEGHCGL